MRLCPNCKAHIEKSEGCNHMTCYYCEFQFCWICGETYTQDHFLALNPLGCGGNQFSNVNPYFGFLGKSWLYFKRFLIFLLVLLLCPFVLVLGPPIGCVAISFAVLNKAMGGCNKCFACLAYLIVCPIAFAIGLALDILIVPAGIFIGIPAFIFWQLYMKYQMWQSSRERLKDRLEEAQNLQRQIDLLRAKSLSFKGSTDSRKSL
jgi:hypothetical protein